MSRPARERKVTVFFLPVIGGAQARVALTDDDSARAYLNNRFGLCKLRKWHEHDDTVIYRVQRASNNERVGHMFYSVTN